MAKTPQKVWMIDTLTTGGNNSLIGVAQKLVGDNHVMINPFDDQYKLPVAEGPDGERKARFDTRQYLADTLGITSRNSDQWPDVLLNLGGPPRRRGVIEDIKLLAPTTPFITNINVPGGRQDVYDLIANGEHEDRQITGKNVIKTRGVAHKVTPELLEAGRREWGDQFGLNMSRPVFSLLVGGNIGPDGKPRIVFKPEHAASIGRMVRDMVVENDGVLIVTNSRRTPEESTHALMDEIHDVPAYFHDWKRDNGNPYFGLLALSDHIIVTGDSMSMCCEATSTGKPVYIWPMEGRVEDNQQKLIDMLFEQGHAKPLTGKFEQWSYTPLDTAGDIAKAIVERFAAREASRVTGVGG